MKFNLKHNNFDVILPDWKQVIWREVRNRRNPLAYVETKIIRDLLSHFIDSFLYFLLGI